MWRLGESCIIVACAAACSLGRGSRGFPLHGDPTVQSGEVVRVYGYVQTIDGRDVSNHGRDFELWPGCHVIGTPQKWGGAGPDAWVTATTGALRFAMHMQAGHYYDVRVHEYESLGYVEVDVAERDSNGELIATHHPVRSQRALDRCRPT